VPAAERRRPAGARPAGPAAARLSGGRHRDHKEDDEEWSNLPEDGRDGGPALGGGGVRETGRGWASCRVRTTTDPDDGSAAGLKASRPAGRVPAPGAPRDAARAGVWPLGPQLGRDAPLGAAHGQKADGGSTARRWVHSGVSPASVHRRSRASTRGRTGGRACTCSGAR
jgi:hypothetical protein